MIKYFELHQFLRNYKVFRDGQTSFFLGSGTSVQAGIPTGSALIWEFKKRIYCTITETLQEKFYDMQSERNQVLLQDFFDAERINPKLGDPSEYSHYFEKCFNTSGARKQFVIELTSNIEPSLGHLCLGSQIITGKIKNVWTTNFDELIEAGVKQLKPGYSINVMSSANQESFSFLQNTNLPNIYKLHGDYRYDNIKNTLDEVRSLESTIGNKFEASLNNGALIVLGYSGSDESIMSVLEKNVNNVDFLPRGLIWLKRKNAELPLRTMKLMETVCAKNENSGIVEIDGFDEFMHSCYQYCEDNNQLIDGRWRDFHNRRLPIYFSAPKADYFIKLNAFESISHPTPFSFDTNITTWKELREIIDDNKIIASIHARKVYCFGSLEDIGRIFKDYILSEIKEEALPQKYLHRDNSFYASMLYDLIEVSLFLKANIKKCGKNKYYNFSRYENLADNNISYKVHDAIEIFLSFINGKYFLSILPTVLILNNHGEPVSDNIKKLLINKKMSSVYNLEYDEKVKYWNGLLKSNDNSYIEFNHGRFSLKFNHICISYGKLPISANFPQKIAYQFDEPVMIFNINNPVAKGINQLRGISNYGPIDFSYAKQDQLRHSIKLSVITPSEDLPKILNHLNKLKSGNKLSKCDGFTLEYNGFENIYKQSIDIPQMTEDKRCLCYNGKNVTTREYLVNLLKEKVDFLSTENHTFSILVIYIPKTLEKFRMGNSEEDFNLHDAIKLYAMDKGIKVQFIEEKSTVTKEPCKVMWALSTSVNAKQGGTLWRPETLNTETAFVGISYAYSNEKGISVGCSQLFDASGTGLRLLLKKIKNPFFINKSPFMRADEARQMMSILRRQYYDSYPAFKLKRIVIHKTTFFTDDEIKGFAQALEGIEDIELLQIQEFTPWRGIRFKDIDFKKGVHNFSMKRGTVIHLSDNQYLLWTHGCVIDKELFNGKGYNYYKGGRGIPAPLLIKRFYGKATGDVLSKEILMLTKMNWNSGDSLYKHLPVTLDFAKVLSRMSKQNEALYDQLYDFRYFM